MSSTSSSEYENDPWATYEYGYNTNYNNRFRSAYGTNPYFPTMGHPLVYYSEMPRRARNLKHRGRDRERGSPNCFVKAFRWYTKEHIPNSIEAKGSESPVKPDMTGFATWLDVKYDQFLRDSHIVSEMYHVKLRQTFEAEKVPTDNTSEQCECCSTKRFYKKSSSKRKRRAKSNETGLTRLKSNQSCRYIMQPKDISRPPSVCCRPTNDDIKSISEYVNKPLAKSQSFSNITMVIKSKEPCETTAPCNAGDAKPIEKVEILPTNKATICQHFCCQFNGETTTKINAETQCDGVVPGDWRCGSLLSNKSEHLADSEHLPGEKKIQKSASRVARESSLCQPTLPCESTTNTVKCECKALDTMPVSTMPGSKVSVNASRHSQKSVKSKVCQNEECQFPEDKAVSVDAQTQCVPRVTVNNATQQHRNTSGFNNISCECDFKGSMQNNQSPVQSVPMPSIQLPPCDCERNVKKELISDRTKVAQTTSQTSNHSICLDKETVEYPFFLKIVCADKLSHENMKSSCRVPGFL